jgi:hypothetical protein
LAAGIGYQPGTGEVKPADRNTAIQIRTTAEIWPDGGVFTACSGAYCFCDPGRLAIFKLDSVGTGRGGGTAEIMTIIQTVGKGIRAGNSDCTITRTTWNKKCNAMLLALKKEHMMCPLGFLLCTVFIVRFSGCYANAA